jgi:predicted aldo/keto reductase-like oxidoreductase
MQYRDLGRTGWKVSTVSFGAWAIGGTWGSVQDTESLSALHRAVDLGVNYFDKPMFMGCAVSVCWCAAKSARNHLHRNKNRRR